MSSAHGGPGEIVRRLRTVASNFRVIGVVHPNNIALIEAAASTIEELLNESRKEGEEIDRLANCLADIAKIATDYDDGRVTDQEVGPKLMEQFGLVP